jgi:hypothetical protein
MTERFFYVLEFVLCIKTGSSEMSFTLLKITTFYWPTRFG